VITLAPSDFAITPTGVLGDEIVRIDDLSFHHSHGRLSGDGRTLALWWRACVVELDIDRWAIEAIHRRDRASVDQRTAPFAGPVFVYIRDGRDVTLYNTRGAGRTFAAPSFIDGTVLASPTRDDEFYVYGIRSLSRLRFEDDVLAVEATYHWTPERAQPGFELRELVFAPDGTTLYARTDRDVVRLDRATLRPIDPAVLFDVNAHNDDPRAWIHKQRLHAMCCHGDALFVLTTRTSYGEAKLLRVALSDRSVTELAPPPDMVVPSLSPVLANGRLMIRGLSGHVAVDAQAFKIVDILRRTSAASSYWTDVDRSVDYALESDGVFTTVRCDDRITTSSREGVVRRYSLRWNDDHIIALSRQRGIERFDPSSPALASIDDARGVPLSPSADGRWAVVERAGAVLAQSTDDPSRSHPLSQTTRAIADRRAFAVTDDGTCWIWDGRDLCSTAGARVTVARRESYASLSLSRDGQRAALTLSKEIVVVDTVNRRELCRIAAPKLVVARCAGTRSLIVTGSDGVRWYDTDTGALVQWHKRRFATELRGASSRDGSLFALVVEGGVVELLVRDDPSAARSFVAAERAQSVAFSPDQTQLVVASSESVLRIFSVEAVLATSAKKRTRARR
jgi:WD40 repeat protein